MKERRQYERFPLTLTARMEMITSARKHVFEFQTKDISAAGAFIHTTESFPLGTRFKLCLTIASDRIKKLTGAQSLIECKGSNVRSTNTGFGVHFDKKCHILSLKCL
jgi:Tfp pilus assembly protein PilZ